MCDESVLGTEDLTFRKLYSRCVPRLPITEYNRIEVETHVSHRINAKKFPGLSGTFSMVSRRRG